MARWDEIMSLPVQNPPILEFSSSDLVWSKVEGWRDNIDRVARIPFARVNNFLSGEASRKDCPTKFHREAGRKRPPKTTYKPKVDGVLEYILYWCSFGPDDHRKGGIVRPSRKSYVTKKKSAGRPNTKRGCTCHFIVKRLIAEPSVALIIYNQDKHIDKKGSPCHGPQDKKAAGTRAMYAPCISEDLRLRVLSLLHVGVSVETIMQRHNEYVEKQGGPSNRDDLLNHRFVRRQERSIRRSTYELDVDDAVSISLWVEGHQSQVFFYEDFSDSNPFTLGIQTEWQLQQMIRFGNCRLLASDSRFGTNKLKYAVHSLVVFNSDNKAIPVAWIIAPKFASTDAHRWMRALFNRVCTKDPTWRLAGFIVDDPLVDISAIREVFQCSVLICLWRVRHAWHKNLMKKCSEIEMRAEISRQLSQSVQKICRGSGTVDLFENIMEDFVDASEFLEYFKAVWYPRIGLWTTVLKTLPLASHESCAAMEFYHNQLKLRLFNEKEPDVYSRADWLIDKLNTKVHSYFWLDEYLEKDDFARYRKDEWLSGLTAWRKSLKIADSCVVLDGKFVKVFDQGDRDKFNTVWNPGSEFGICDCHWAELGNLCEHVLKVIRVLSDRGQTMSSASMSKYSQALRNMLCCPHDSLIRDHAVSLAVWVQKQLAAQIDPENNQIMLDLQAAVPFAASDVAHNITESNHANENIISSMETDLVGYDVSNGIISDSGGDLNALVADGSVGIDPYAANADNYRMIEKKLANENISSNNENDCSLAKLANENISSNNENDCSLAVSDCIADQLSEDLMRMEDEIDVCEQKAGRVISCAEMEVDPTSICSSASGLITSDGIASEDIFMDGGERAVGDTGPDVTKNFPSADVILANLMAFEQDLLDNYHQDVIDVDSQANKISPVELESPNQSTADNQNGFCNDQAEPSVIHQIVNKKPDANLAEECHVSIMDVDSQCNTNPGTTLNSLHQNTDLHQNGFCSDSAEPLVSHEKADDETETNNIPATVQSH